jgi:hypothetical protein
MKLGLGILTIVSSLYGKVCPDIESWCLKRDKNIYQKCVELEKMI